MECYLIRRSIFSYLLPPHLFYQIAAVDAGVLSAMEAYHEVGGIPMVTSEHYLKDLLRDEMGFTGTLVTDYREIMNLHDFHKVSDTYKDAVAESLTQTSIDMSMVPSNSTFFEYTLDLVKAGVISKKRIEESARRVLELKNLLGLLDTPIPTSDDPLVDTVGQDEDWEASLAAARETITLLKNTEGLLPLSPDSLSPGESVFVTGYGCDSLRAQTGGWSFHWQGPLNDAEFVRGTTIKAGLEQVGFTVRMHGWIDLGCGG